MSRFLHLIISLLVILLLLSCDQKKMQVPENMMQPEELVPLLVELHLADGYLHNLKITQYQKRDTAFYLYPGILKKYEVSRPQLDSTILFYGKHPDEFSKLYDKVLEELSKMEGEARAADTLKTAADSLR